MKDYVHGYTKRETTRLNDQAQTLTDILHHDTVYPAGCRVLEAGCGTGAQTKILAKRCPATRFVSIDVCGDSIDKAVEIVKLEGVGNVEFQQADIFKLPFEPESFDHVFVCFVLEHLARPEKALNNLKRVIRPGGSITVIEGDHGSFFCHPMTDKAANAVRCLVDLQARMGGNSLVGRELYPLLDRSGFCDVAVSPRMVYVDDSRPELVEGFSKNTFIAMVEGVRSQVLENGISETVEWEAGIRDLNRATEKGGTFCYTFFKATATRDR